MRKSVYIIGDVHGQLDKLDSLYKKIKDFRNTKLDEHITLIYVGDYIDRGPESKRVLQIIMDQVNNPFSYGFDNVVALKGNHEDMMKNDRDCWMNNGGVETLESFDKDWYEKIQSRNYSLIDLIGEDIWNFVDGLPIYYETGSIAVAHAGIDNADLKCDQHYKDELLWSRRLRTQPHQIYKYTVHGHTPMEKIKIGKFVSYIDSGAAFGEYPLSCLYIPDVDNPQHTEMSLIQSV